jgi:hypothetical protein
MKHTLRIAVALTVFAVSMPAAVIFNNGASNLITGDNMSEFLVAEDFALATAYNVTGLRFWSLQSSAGDYRNSVYWAIHSNGGSAPGSILFGGLTASVAAVATGNSTFYGYNEYRFDIPVAFQLAAGTYWLSLHNGALANETATEMLWAATTPGSGLAGVYTSSGLNPAWIDTSQEHAFEISGNPVGTGQVPEPGSVLLLGSGLAIVLLRLKRR